MIRWLIRLPYWNRGRNHIILDTHDLWAYGSDYPYALGGHIGHWLSSNGPPNESHSFPVTVF